eukprot:COSAG02_NODE_10666_length_1887_cov_1.157159_3_plen_280_part_00
MPRIDNSAGQGLLAGAATESGREMQIFVTTVTGKTIALSACDSDSGAVVKARLQNMEGIPANQQSLFYGKQQLEDDDTLAGCGVRREGTLRLVLTQPDAAMRSGRSGSTNAMMLSGLSTEDAAASSINSRCQPAEKRGCGASPRAERGLLILLAVLAVMVQLSLTAKIAFSDAIEDDVFFEHNGFPTRPPGTAYCTLSTQQRGNELMLTWAINRALDSHCVQVGGVGMGGTGSGTILLSQALFCPKYMVIDSTEYHAKSWCNDNSNPLLCGTCNIGAIM